MTTDPTSARVEGTLDPLLAKMTEDQLRFSYRAVLHVVARRQLGLPVDGNLATILVAIQQDVDAAKADIQANVPAHPRAVASRGEAGCSAIQ